MLTGMHEAQVISALPDGRLQVMLRDANALSAKGHTVRVLKKRASRSSGSYGLPTQGDWGIVAFTVQDGRNGYWLGSFDDDYSSLNPDELLEVDPMAELEHHPGDQYTVHHGDGSDETRYPDGTLFKIQTSKDGSLSNAGLRAQPTERYARRKAGEATSSREGFQPHTEPPVDITLRHASGASFEMTADGNVNLATPQGHSLRVHDGTERVRADTYPHDVTGTPEEDAGRVNSEIHLETEQGHKVVLHDDPQNNQDRHIAVSTPKGHRVELRDSGEVKTTISTPAGYTIELHDDKKTITLITPGGRAITLDDSGQNITIDDPKSLVLKAPMWSSEGRLANLNHSTMNLAGGGPGVARSGDVVQVTIASGSSAGVWPGVIVSGSAKVFSG